MGPPKSAGAGAAQGFARKNNVAVEELTPSDGQGEYFRCGERCRARDARALAEALPAMIAKIPWPRRCIGRQDGLRFIRRSAGLCAAGDQIVEFEVAGVASGALSAAIASWARRIAFDHVNYEERLEKTA